MRSEMDVRIAATAASQHGVFSRAQAMQAGAGSELIRSRCRSGRWEVLARNVFRLPGAPPTWRQAVMAAVLEAGPDAVASHRTAAALLGLPGYLEGPIEVTRRECKDHVVALSRLHQSSLLPDQHRLSIDGIPCTNLSRTVFDLAGSEHRRRFESTARHAISRLGLSIGRLEQVLALLGGRGRAGTRAVREFLDGIGDGYVPTESELEDVVRAVLAAAGLPRPDVQADLGGEGWIGRVDFYYRDAKVVIEAQSRRHHASWEAQQADMARRAELAAAGYLVIEVTWWQLVHEPHVFVDRVRRALRVAA